MNTTTAPSQPTQKRTQREARKELIASLKDPNRRWDALRSGPTPHVLAEISQRYTLNADATAKITALLGELSANLDVRNPRTAVDAFIGSADSFDDFCDRRATVRFVELVSGVDTGTIPESGKAIGTHSYPWHGCAPAYDPNMRNRVLTDLEDALVAYRALDNPIHAATIGSLASGINTAELHLISDTPQAHADGTMTITAPGTTCDVTTCTIGGGHRCITPRPTTIVAWASVAIKVVAAARRCCDPLLYRPVKANLRTPEAGEICNTCRRYPIVSMAKAQSTLLMRVKDVLKDVGLGDDPTVKPLSIRNTAARRVAETAGLEAAVQLLGYSSYDAVATEIGMIPRPPTRRHK